jgi:hypothetical protein
MKGETMKSEKIIKARRRAWVNWTFLTLFLIGIPSLVHADVGDILLKFHPFITAQEMYSNNILLSQTNKISDFITVVSPGFSFVDLAPGTYGINLDVVAGYTYYEKNHDFSYFSPRLNLNAWYAISPTLTFRLREYLIRSDAARESLLSAGAESDQSLLSTERGVHAIYLRNVAQPSMEYHFGRENLFSVLYRNNVYHNQKSDLFESSQENTIDPKINYWFDIRNGVTLEYILTYGHFQRSPDLVGNGARGRYTYRFDTKLSIFGQYSFQRESFKDPGVDYDVHNPSLGVEYRFSPTLTGTAQAGYYWQIPDQGSRTKGPFFNMSLMEKGERTTYTLLLQGGYNQDYFTAQNLGFNKYYTAFGAIDHRFTERMSIRATGSGERAMYAGGRKDWIWNVRGGPAYLLFRWLSLSLEASYRMDHSNISGLGYKEYRGIFGITLAQPGFQQPMQGSF